MMNRYGLVTVDNIRTSCMFHIKSQPGKAWIVLLELLEGF